MKRKYKDLVDSGWYYLPATDSFYKKTPDGFFNSTATLELMDDNDEFVGPLTFPSTATQRAPLKIDNCIPRAWRHRENGSIAKVLPWFQPIDESRIDFRGLLKEIDVGFSDDMLGNFNCYSGMLLQAGWQFENSNGVWFCVAAAFEDAFEDLGAWDDSQPYAKERRIRLDADGK